MEGLDQLAAVAEALGSNASPTPRKLGMAQANAKPAARPRGRPRKDKGLPFSGYASLENLPTSKASNAPHVPASLSVGQQVAPPMPAPAPAVFIELPVASFAGLPADLFTSKEPSPKEAPAEVKPPKAAPAAKINTTKDKINAPQKKKRKKRSKSKPGTELKPNPRTDEEKTIAVLPNAISLARKKDTIHSSKIFGGKLRQYIWKNKVPGLLTRAERCRAAIVVHLAENPGVAEKEIRESYGQVPDISKALRQLLEEGMVSKVGDGTKRAPYLWTLLPKGLQELEKDKEALKLDDEARLKLIDELKAAGIELGESDDEKELLQPPLLGTATDPAARARFPEIKRDTKNNNKKKKSKKEVGASASAPSTSAAAKKAAAAASGKKRKDSNSADAEEKPAKKAKAVQNSEKKKIEAKNAEPTAADAGNHRRSGRLANGGIAPEAAAAEVVKEQSPSKKAKSAGGGSGSKDAGRKK